jgi:uncharacterized protein (TIGR03435 family)
MSRKLTLIFLAAALAVRPQSFELATHAGIQPARFRDRFHPATHHETRELTAYEMVIDKSGPKVHTVGASGGFDSNPFRMTDSDRITGTKVTAAMLAKVLAEQVKHPVEDATGFKDAFNFTGNGRRTPIPPPIALPSSPPSASNSVSASTQRKNPLTSW